MRRGLVIFLISAILLLPSLAWSQTGKVKPDPAQATVENLYFILATANPGGTYFPMGMSMATMWSLNLSEEKGIKVKAITSSGSEANVNLLRYSDADLAIMEARVARMAYNGFKEFDGAPYKGLRTVTSLWPDVAHFVVNREDIITSNVTDIRGLRLAIGKAGSGAATSTLDILAGLGMTMADINYRNMSYFEGARAMKQRLIQGVILPGGVPLAAVTDIFSSPNLKPVLLGFDQRQIDKVAESSYYPAFAYTIKAGTYPGQDFDVRAIAQANLLTCRPEMKDEVVYELLQVLFDNNGGMLDNRVATDEWLDVKNALTGVTTPLHPGAVKFYREKGMEIPYELLPPELRPKNVP